MPKVQEGMAPWLFEGTDRESYRAEQRKNPVASEKKEKMRISAQAYWKQCLEVKELIMRYVSLKKLAMNVADPQKRHSVKHVIDRYYSGYDSRVYTAAEDLRILVDRKVRMYNRMCLENDLDQSDVDTLIYQMTTIPDAGEKFKHHLEKHRDEGYPPFPLDEVAQHDFRFYHPAWYGKEGGT